MKNIPTDLLRTLVTICDTRSYTKAAKILGVTQPAVSAQIKRLQQLLGREIFDRASPGVTLSSYGETVVEQARRMLDINDQIFRQAPVKPRQPFIRIGLPGDLSGPLLPWTIAKFRKHHAEFGYSAMSGSTEELLISLDRGDVDIVVGLSRREPTRARHVWTDPLVWVRSDATKISPSEPVPMLAFSLDCMCYCTGLDTLEKSGRESRLIMTAGTVLTLSAGVDAGLGTLVMTKSRVKYTQLDIWENPPLPALPPLYVGIYVRDGDDNAPLLELADELAPALRPKDDQSDDGRRAYHSLRHAFNTAEELAKKASAG